jgi:hypothetical protein
VPGVLPCGQRALRGGEPTFGICTLSKKHVRWRATTWCFRYVGKQRKDQRQVVADTPLVEIIEELKEQPGRGCSSTASGRARYRPVTASGGEPVPAGDPGREAARRRTCARSAARCGPPRSWRTSARPQSRRKRSGTWLLACKLVARTWATRPRSPARPTSIPPCWRSTRSRAARWLHPRRRSKQAGGGGGTGGLVSGRAGAHPSSWNGYGSRRRCPASVHLERSGSSAPPPASTAGTR